MEGAGSRDTCCCRTMMSKKIVFVVLDQFAEWEYAYLASALSMIGEGAYVNTVASVSTDPIHSVGGMTVVPDTDLSAVADADALVLVGGMAWKTAASEKAAPVVAEFWKTGKPLGAICDGVSVLATDGILNDRRHTGNSVQELSSWAEDAYTGQKLFEEQPAVTDGNLVTANGTATLEFARDMMLLLGLNKVDVQEWYVFHKKGLYSAPMPSKIAK